MSITDSLPPVAQLLSVEKLSEKSFIDAKKYFLDLLPELRRQAEWSIENFSYIDSKEFQRGSKFISTPVSGLNPFSAHGKCAMPLCRISNAKSFAQTLGLYSDMIMIHDPFTANFIDDREWSDDNILSFLTDVVVFQELTPLINNGVIHFLNPSAGFCSSCYTKLEQRVRQLATSSLEEFNPKLKVLRIEDHAYIDTGTLYDPPIFHGFSYPENKSGRISKRTLMQSLNEMVSDEIMEILVSCYSAPVQESAIFSNSRIALKTVNQLEGINISRREFDSWEASHSADLPWVRDLSVDQIVNLREEAANALPQLRELLAAKVAAKSAKAAYGSEQQSLQLANELRASAAEVEAELKAINIAGERRFQNVAGVLGLTVAIYGFGQDLMTPSVALTSLLTTLGFIHTVSKKDEQDIRKITAKPGYVFVKAKEMLGHAKQSHIKN